MDAGVVTDVLPPAAPSVTASAPAPVLERTLHVAPAFQRANTASVTGPVAADLTLRHAQIPTSGGRFTVYLVDPANGAPIRLGDLAVVGPTYQRIGTVHVYVELPTRALEILRETSAPKVRIVQEREGGGALVVGSVELAP